MYYEMLKNVRRNEETRSVGYVTLTIDLETGRQLDFLRQELQSPKSWIIRRLVQQEYTRYTTEKDKDKKKMEVVAR